MSLDWDWCLLFRLYSPSASQAEYWTDYSVKTLKVFVSYIWWQVPGVGNTGIHHKMSSYLFKHGLRSPLPISRSCLRWYDGWKQPVRECKESFLALSGYIGGNFFWNGVKRGEVLWRSVSFRICSLRATWVLIIAAVKTLFLSRNSQMPNDGRTFHPWHGQIRQRGLTVYVKRAAVVGLWPPVSHRPVWQPTSQCSNVVHWNIQSFQPKFVRHSV